MNEGYREQGKLRVICRLCCGTQANSSTNTAVAATGECHLAFAGAVVPFVHDCPPAERLIPVVNDVHNPSHACKREGPHNKEEQPCKAAVATSIDGADRALTVRHDDGCIQVKRLPLLLLLAALLVFHRPP